MLPKFLSNLDRGINFKKELKNGEIKISNNGEKIRLMKLFIDDIFRILNLSKLIKMAILKVQILIYSIFWVVHERNTI